MNTLDLVVMKSYDHPSTANFAIGEHISFHRTHVPINDRAMYHPIILAFAAIASASSFLAGMLAQGKAEPAAGFLNVPNSYLWLVCMSGAIAGGMVSVFIVPTIETRKQLIFKFLASSITSMVFAPRIISWMAWSQAPDSILMISSGLALVAWGALLKIVPVASDWLTGIFRAFANKGNPPDTSDNRHQ